MRLIDFAIGAISERAMSLLTIIEQKVKEFQNLGFPNCSRRIWRSGGHGLDLAMTTVAVQARPKRDDYLSGNPLSKWS